MPSLSRSWSLFRQSWSVLMADKELMVLPILSGLSILVIVLGYLVPLGLLTGFESTEELSPGTLVALGVSSYILVFTAAFFFQTAVIAGALERMRGGDPTVGSALRAASARLGTIVVWGIVAGTVGWILKALQERSEVLGRILYGLIGVAWSLATFFMAPVIIVEGRGLRDSFGRSWGLFKQTWGETVVGSAGIGLITFLATLAVVAFAGALAGAGLVLPGVVIGVLGVLLVMIVSSALQGIYVAALYRMATQGEAPAGFDAAMLRAAFGPKG